MARVGRSSMQLVVLQLAFLNKLLIADVLEVDADKLLGKLFRDGTSEMALQGLVIEVCAWSMMVELCEELGKGMVSLTQGNELPLG